MIYFIVIIRCGILLLLEDGPGLARVCLRQTCSMWVFVIMQERFHSESR